jgi:hypothetical protein
MRAVSTTSVAALVLLLVGCNNGASGDAGAGGDAGSGVGGGAGNRNGGENEVLEPMELPNLPDAVDQISGFYLSAVEAFVRIENGYEFRALRYEEDGEVRIPDSSCSWGLIRDTPFGPVTGVGVIASLYRYELLNGVSQADADDTFSFWRLGDGDTQWGLFDSGFGERGEEWSSVPGGSEEMACIEFISPTPEYVLRLCQISWAGTAAENFSVRKSSATVQLNCLFARKATPDDVPADCSRQDDPCVLRVPDGEGGCTIGLPRDSTFSPIECDLDGGPGMCVAGECVEHGCNGTCDDGHPATSDSCQRTDSEAAWECVHEEV